MYTHAQPKSFTGFTMSILYFSLTSELGTGGDEATASALAKKYMIGDENTSNF